jgi:uncharacterized protein
MLDYWQELELDGVVMDQIAETILNVVRLIVDNPGDVSMKIVPYEDEVQLRLSVSPIDAGKVIGREGRTARSLRTILTAMSRTRNENIRLEIVA